MMPPAATAPAPLPADPKAKFKVYGCHSCTERFVTSEDRQLHRLSHNHVV